MTDSRERPGMMGVVPYVSLAIAIGVQAGGAIWWAGTTNARITMLEQSVDEISGMQREIAGALQGVAILEERFMRVDQALIRIETAVERIAESAP